MSFGEFSRRLRITPIEREGGAAQRRDRMATTPLEQRGGLSF